MKKLLGVGLVVCVVVSGQFLFAAGRAEDKAARELAPMTLRYGISTGPGSVLERKGQFFRQRVAEKTAGKLTIGVFPSGQLGTMLERIQGISMGTVDMGAESEMFMDALVKDFGILSVPFLLTREELLTLPLIKDLREELRQKHGIRTLAGLGFRPPFHLFTRGRPVATPGELQGFKVRLWGGAVVHVWNGMGAAGVMTHWGDTYLALAQGVVDGIFHNMASVFDGKIHEVVSYCMMIDALNMNDATWINDKLFQSLPAAWQKALEEASQESADWQTENFMIAATEGRKAAEARGVKFLNVDRTVWQARSMEVARRLEKEGLWSQGLLKRLGKE